MAIPYDITAVEAELNTYTTQDEKIKYLQKYLFELKKEESQVIGMGSHKRDWLIKKTEKDYNIYMEFIHNGGMIYLNSRYNKETGSYDIHKSDLGFAQRHKIEDLNLLLRRLAFDIRDELQGRIKLFEALIEREKAFQQTEIKQETPTFINNFDNIKPTEIYKHFKAGLVEKGYLTEQELNEYLKAAFELQTKPETLFKLKHTPTKQKIYTVFYTYYKDISQKKHERQKEYAALLGDFFEGYKTEIIQTNWARGYKTKR